MTDTVLITGVGGFIFSNFVRKAVHEKHPYKFVSVDKITKSNLLHNIYVNDSMHSFYIGDVCDAHFMDILFEKERPNIVVHGAAETYVDASLKNPNVFVKSNILGTQVVINNCIKWGVEKLIYISTDEVYGQLENELDSSWTEDSVINPRNPYSASKAAGEMLVKAASYSHGLKYNITRSSNNYGPRQDPEKLIPKTIKCVLNEQKIPIYGQGSQMREWMHVYDNCNAILTIMKFGKENEIYNISSGQELTNLEVVQRICNTMGKGHNLIDHIKDPRTGHDFRYSVDSSKIKNIGWKSDYKFSDGLVDTIDWYYRNKWFLK